MLQRPYKVRLVFWYICCKRLKPILRICQVQLTNWVQYTDANWFHVLRLLGSIKLYLFYKVDVYMCQVIDLKTHESSYERQYNSHDLLKWVSSVTIPEHSQSRQKTTKCLELVKASSLSSSLYSLINIYSMNTQPNFVLHFRKVPWKLVQNGYGTGQVVQRETHQRKLEQ